MTKQEQIQMEIALLRQAVPEIKGVMVATVDGLAIGTDLPEAEGARVAAMSATALGLGKRIAQVTELSALEEVMIQGKSGYLLVYAIGNKGVMALQAPQGTNLGLMRLEARSTATKLEHVLG